MHSSRCVPSACALVEPSSRPVRHWNQDPHGHDHQTHHGDADAERAVLHRFDAGKGDRGRRGAGRDGDVIPSSTL